MPVERVAADPKLRAELASKLAASDSHMTRLARPNATQQAVMQSALLPTSAFPYLQGAIDYSGGWLVAENQEGISDPPIRFFGSCTIRDISVRADTAKCNFEIVNNVCNTGPTDFQREASLALRAPDGTEVQLVASSSTSNDPGVPGGLGSNVFTVAAVQAWPADNRPISSGTGQAWRPVGDLTALRGKPAAGEWRMRYGSSAPGDPFALRGWVLSMACEEAVEPTCGTFAGPNEEIAWWGPSAEQNAPVTGGWPDFCAQALEDCQQRSPLDDSAPVTLSCACAMWGCLHPVVRGNQTPFFPCQPEVKPLRRTYCAEIRQSFGDAATCPASRVPVPPTLADCGRIA